LARTPFFIKVCRYTDEQPSFTPLDVIKKFANGVETSVVLDLNILSIMREAMDPSSEISADGRTLLEMRRILNTPLLFVSPGLALGEADESYLIPLHNAFEAFLQTHLQGYIDAPNATCDYAERVWSKNFNALPEVDRQFLSVSYLALLKIHDILLSSPKASGEAKFDLFLEYMDGVANFVPALESEVAKFCFSEKSILEASPFAEICKAIRDNFNKGGRGQKRVERVLNGARDLMYLRSVAMMDGKTFDGRLQNTWLLTCDKGIAALATAIYFYPKDGEASKYVTHSKYETRRNNPYWRYVDAMFSRQVEIRQLEGLSMAKTHGTQTHLTRLVIKTQELEARVSSYS
jgi:hypothetical protein